MYIPAHFEVTDRDTLFEFIEQHAFGLLVSQTAGETTATHLPFLVDRERGVLKGHIAKQNPQWRELTSQSVLAIFNGPHAYISPTWYHSVRTVPTWNYVAVHAYGSATLIEDATRLLDLVAETTARFEREMPTPWSFDGSEDFARKLASQIIGFEIQIERLDGKWKLNQNHPIDRRQRVIAALREQGYEDARTIADLMESGLTKPAIRPS